MDSSENIPALVKPMSLGNWLLTIFLISLPCVGFILAIIWACDTANVNRRNYCRAFLALLGLMVVLQILWNAFIFMIHMIS